MRAWRHERAKYVGRRVSGEEGQQIRPERQVGVSTWVELDSAAHQLCDLSKLHFLSLPGFCEEEMQSCLGVPLP